MAVLTARELVVGFAGGFRVGPLTLSLGPGVHRLAGPNGSGKTTLLRALGGALWPLEGVAEVDGVDLHRVPAARARVALVPARPDLPAFLTVDEAWRTTAALRRRADWDGAPYREALGLPAHLRLGHASTGQRARAELLAALAGDPPVLLLDETFAHLDVAGVDWLSAQVAGWRSERVVVLAHHGGSPVELDSEVDVTAAAGVS